MREYRVDCGGIRLSVRDHPGGEPPVIALHGLASNARWWDLVATRLAPAHRVIAVDQRGHGKSDRPAGGYDFATVCEDLRTLTSTLGIGPAVVTGHSWGATVALSYAVDHPDLTLGIVCVDGGVADLRHFFGATWEVAEKAMTPPDMRNLSEVVLRRRLARSALSEGSDPDTALGILMGNFEEMDGELRPRLSRTHHMAIAHALYHVDRDALLQRVRRPTLLALARRRGADTAEREASLAGALRVLGRRGRALWIDGQHDLPVQRPEEVARAINANMAWLQGTRD